MNETDHDVGIGKEEGRAWPFADLDLGNVVLAFVLQLKLLRSCLGIWVAWLVSSHDPFFFLCLGLDGSRDNLTCGPGIMGPSGRPAGRRPGFGSS